MKPAILAIILVGVSCNALAADEKVTGLICDYTINGQDLKMELGISVKEDNARLTFRNSQSLTGSGSMQVPADSVQPILKQDLAAMDGVALEDKEANTLITFKVRGFSFDGQPRLKVEIAGPDLDLTLESCNPKIDRPFRIN